MGRVGNEKPTPFLTPSSSLTGLEKVWRCLVRAHLCIFFFFFFLKAPLGSTRPSSLALPPSLPPSCFTTNFNQFGKGQGGGKWGVRGWVGLPAGLIQLCPVIGWLAFRGGGGGRVAERLKTSVAQMWLRLCSVWSQVSFVTTKRSPHHRSSHPNRWPSKYWSCRYLLRMLGNMHRCDMLRLWKKKENGVYMQDPPPIHTHSQQQSNKAHPCSEIKASQWHRAQSTH